MGDGGGSGLQRVEGRSNGPTKIRRPKKPDILTRIYVRLTFELDKNRQLQISMSLQWIYLRGVTRLFQSSLITLTVSRYNSFDEFHVKSSSDKYDAFLRLSKRREDDRRNNWRFVTHRRVVGLEARCSSPCKHTKVPYVH